MTSWLALISPFLFALTAQHDDCDLFAYTSDNLSMSQLSICIRCSIDCFLRLCHRDLLPHKNPMRPHLLRITCRAQHPIVEALQEGCFQGGPTHIQLGVLRHCSCDASMVSLAQRLEGRIAAKICKSSLLNQLELEKKTCMEQWHAPTAFNLSRPSTLRWRCKTMWEFFSCSFKSCFKASFSRAARNRFSISM